MIEEQDIRLTHSESEFQNRVSVIHPWNGCVLHGAAYHRVPCHSLARVRAQGGGGATGLPSSLQKSECKLKSIFADHLVPEMKCGTVGRCWNATENHGLVCNPVCTFRFFNPRSP